MPLPLAQDQLPPPAPLPAPPLFVHWTVESPWPLAGLLALAAAGAFITLNRRGRFRQGVLAAAGLLACAGAVPIAGSLVTTAREAVSERTRGLIDSGAKADMAALQDALAENLRFTLFAQARASTREQFLDLVRKYPGGEYPVTAHWIDELQAAIDGPHAARTQLHLTVHSRDATLYDLPVGSWWLIGWRLDEDGVWRADDLECLQMDGAARPR